MQSQYTNLMKTIQINKTEDLENSDIDDDTVLTEQTATLEQQRQWISNQLAMLEFQEDIETVRKYQNEPIDDSHKEWLDNFKRQIAQLQESGFDKFAGEKVGKLDVIDETDSSCYEDSDDFENVKFQNNGQVYQNSSPKKYSDLIDKN